MSINYIPTHKHFRFLKALSALTRAIGDSNETLQVLRLDWNGISGEVSANIFKNIMIKSKSLKTLDLSWNK